MKLGFCGASAETGVFFDGWEHAVWLRELPDRPGEYFFVSNGPNGRFDGGARDDIIAPWPEVVE